MEINKNMKLLDANEERVIIRLDNGTIVTVNEEELVLKCRVGNARKTKKFGYKDMIMMNDLICQIMSEIIEERNKVKQKLERVQQRGIYCNLCICKTHDIDLPFEEKTRK